MRALIRALICILMLIATSFEPLLASETSYLNEVVIQAKTIGSGSFTYLGLPIYDATLYRSSLPSSAEFALEIRYQRSISGTSLANRTGDEMKKVGVSEKQADVWSKDLAAVLPNVQAGDMLTATYTPKRGTTFFYNQKPLAKMPGEDFSKAFFGIWFSEKTSLPKPRSALLGQTCLSPLFSEPC